MSLKHALAATELYLQHNENPLLKRGLDIKELAKPMTNGDRIRAMTDEELAAFVCKRCQDCSPITCPGTELCNGADGPANGMVKWLKQPVKEDADNA